MDGNDPLAVYRVTRDALTRAREGGGPTLIEAVTYRMGPHSTSDDPTRYRSGEEVAEWAKRDPVRRFAEHLRKAGVVDEEKTGTLAAEASEQVQRAVKACEAASPVPPESMVEDVYAEVPWHLSEQRKILSLDEG